MASEQAQVIKKFGSCDYFIADGPSGLYVFEWYGGHDPDEGDILVGDINSYGMVEVYYPQYGITGSLWVEDYLESKRAAFEEIENHC